MYRRTRVSFGLVACLTALASSCKDSTGPERPGAPVDIRVSAGDAQTGGAGLTLAAPIAAKVTDAKGRGVPNIEVAFQPGPGSGSVTPASSRTNGAGVAITSWTLPPNAGADARVRAVFVDTLTGALVDSVTFTAKVVGGPPAVMQVANSPYRAATGSTVPLSVKLWDKYWNVSPHATVSWAVTSGGGSVSAPTSTSDSTGVATIVFTLGSNAGTNTVTATAGSLEAQFTISGVVAGQPASLQPNSYPSMAPIGGTVQLGLTVLDGLGQPAPGATVKWSVLGGGGTLSAATSVTNSQGVAGVQYTLGSVTGRNTVLAQVGALSLTFDIDGRILTDRLAYLNGGGYGIARTSGGRFVVTQIYSGRVVTFLESSPNEQQVINVGGTLVTVDVDQAGTFAYISDMNNYVHVIDLRSNAIVAHVQVPGAHALRMSPAGDRVYVASYNGLVYALSTTTRELVASVPVPNGPWGIAFHTTATDSLMYVTARDGGTITEIDMKTMVPLRTFDVGGRPHGLAISPDGRTLYTADDGQGKVKQVDVATGTVTATVTLDGAFGIAISPDGTTLYATTNGTYEAVINAASLTITKLYETGGDGREVISAPDGTRGYAANEGGWVDIIKR